MRRESQKQNQEENNLCAICMKRKVSADIDCCNHQFCSTCIKDWVKGESKSCPLCRNDVNLITSIRTGSILYRVRRQTEHKPEVFRQSNQQNRDSSYYSDSYQEQSSILSEILNFLVPQSEEDQKKDSAQIQCQKKQKPVRKKQSTIKNVKNQQKPIKQISQQKRRSAIKQKQQKPILQKINLSKGLKRKQKVQEQNPVIKGQNCIYTQKSSETKAVKKVSAQNQKPVKQVQSRNQIILKQNALKIQNIDSNISSKRINKNEQAFKDEKYFQNEIKKERKKYQDQITRKQTLQNENKNIILKDEYLQRNNYFNEKKSPKQYFYEQKKPNQDNSKYLSNLWNQIKEQQEQMNLFVRKLVATQVRDIERQEQRQRQQKQFIQLTNKIKEKDNSRNGPKIVAFFLIFCFVWYVLT